MRHRRFAALIALVVVLLAVPGRAYASEWPAVSVCTEAEITGGGVLEYAPGNQQVNVGGYVRACPGASEPQARWSVARYGTGAANVVARPMPYNATDTRGFRFGYWRDVDPGMWAVCVVSEVRPTAAASLLYEANRVACVGRDPAGPGPGPIPRTLLVPLPVDDPRFSGALLTEQGPNGPRPICAGCV